ncbi:MAG TPA: SIR2 family protein [Solirubrobacteraceae bacterium]|nr:SIR2 family protein [Solirubrobacteraceae bacterium]
MSVQRADDNHYWLVASRLLAGRVVPFLGAGANLCGRPQGVRFQRGQYLPSGSELAEVLARRSRYPVADDLDLLRVSQYVGAVLGEGALYEYLHNTFDADYPPTALHRFLADMPRLLRERDAPPMLLLTTNYDDALERAFADAGEAFDLLWYEAKAGSACGHFIHRDDDGVHTILRPNEYTALAGAERTVILKLHGAVDRLSSKNDSYVITEDHYIDYLARSDIRQQIPVTLREAMAESHFLFLGYSLRDWNLRVILHRIWGSATLDLKSWAIQVEQGNGQLSEIEQKLWARRGDVDLLYVPLDQYVDRLAEYVAKEAEADLMP